MACLPCQQRRNGGRIIPVLPKKPQDKTHTQDTAQAAAAARNKIVGNRYTGRK